MADLVNTGAANATVEGVGTVEGVLNLKLINVLTAIATGPTNKVILQPPFNADNIFLDNDRVKVPSATTDTEYIKFVINYAGSIQSTKDVYNRIGIATVSVFTPLGKGAKRSGDIFTVIRKTMQGVKYVAEVLKITTVDYDKVGEVGGMYMTNIDINFSYFE